MTIKTPSTYPNFYEVQHPLIAYKLSRLRDKYTEHKLFRELVHEITLLLGYEATAHLATQWQTIETPLEHCSMPVLASPNAVILPILRAGIGMVDAMLTLMPYAKVGHIGLFRNETTLSPESYYFKVPVKTHKYHFFVCDPMLATGGSAIQAVSSLKEKGVQNITFICILAAPEGLQKFFKVHPDVGVFSASLDRTLDAQGYIRPGMGDAGDRLFGTQ